MRADVAGCGLVVLRENILVYMFVCLCLCVYYIALCVCVCVCVFYYSAQSKRVFVCVGQTKANVCLCGGGRPDQVYSRSN